MMSIDVLIAGLRSLGHQQHADLIVEIKSERDTYRDLCGELLEAARKLRFISPNSTQKIDSAITKAEKILGAS